MPRREGDDEGRPTDTVMFVTSMGGRAARRCGFVGVGVTCHDRPVAELRTSPRLEAIPRYEPGLTTAQVLAEFGLDAAIRLASNESPYAPLPEVEEVVAAGIGGLNRYPDGAARALIAALADRHGVDREQIVVGNGSGELILLAGQALLDPGSSVIHAEPSFALYPQLATAAGARGIAVPLSGDGGHDLETMAAMVDETTRLVVICNPNNPTGTYRSADAIEACLDTLPDDLAVLVDEAYNDFVTAPDSGRLMSLARDRPNLLVTRTFSKAHGLCGLRVGYGVGSRGWIAALQRVRPPFNTNALGQLAARESLRHAAALAERVALTVSERERVAAALSSMGMPFTPSQGNFMLLTPGDDPGLGQRIHRRMLERGIILRDGTALGCPGSLRVTVGTPAENDRLLDELADVFAAETVTASGAEREAS